MIRKKQKMNVSEDVSIYFFFTDKIDNVTLNSWNNDQICTLHEINYVPVEIKTMVYILKYVLYAF